MFSFKKLREIGEREFFKLQWHLWPIGHSNIYRSNIFLTKQFGQSIIPQVKNLAYLSIGRIEIRPIKNSANHPESKTAEQQELEKRQLFVVKVRTGFLKKPVCQVLWSLLCKEAKMAERFFA